jgi:hypothetical protein
MKTRYVYHPLDARSVETLHAGQDFVSRAPLYPENAIGKRGAR